MIGVTPAWMLTEKREPYLRWHPVTGGTDGKVSIEASRVPDEDCYIELNRRTMEAIHEAALRENLEQACQS